MEKPSSVEDYLDGLAEDSRAAIEVLRGTIRSAAPEATEGISYGMPGFIAYGRSLVTYAAFKDHYSLFPMGMDAIEAYRDELEPYLSGKGTIRFSMDERLPKALVKKIVRTRLAENAARARR